MDRRETVDAFKDRLTELIRRSGLSRAAFASRSGLDRSTLSQLLATGNTRLPRAETLSAIAIRESVSLDWLLGLSQEDHLGTGILQESLEVAHEPDTPVDERLAQWHAEATGYKIRYVPTTIPDLLKTPEVIDFEYEAQGRGVRDTQMDQRAAKLAYVRRPETDIEACCSRQSVEAFARGHDLWQDLPRTLRLAQLRHMIQLLDELYPTFRWFLFDGLQKFSAPYTIFGPTRAAVYMGGIYFVLNSTEHVRVLTRHFEDLIRAAVVQPPDVKDLLTALLSDLEKEPVEQRKGAS